MARGFEGVRGASQDIQDRKNSGGGGGKLFFKLTDGDSAVVRFLEQGDDVKWAWVHELPPAGNRPVGDKIPCRAYDDEGRFTGEDCPGCEKQLKRTFQGAINLIWRNAPVFKRDENKRLVKENGAVVVVGESDQIGVWVSGITVFDDLSETDSTYKGLCSRDFKITRRGSALNTKYSINPADPDGGPKPMSAADNTLALEKYDLISYVEAPSYDTWGKAKTNTASGSGGTTTPADTSPFMRNRD